MATANQTLDIGSNSLLGSLLHAADSDNKKGREKVTSKKKLETRRAIEDYLESRRMRKNLDEYYFEE
jgi:hypothetical protein